MNGQYYAHAATVKNNTNNTCGRGEVLEKECMYTPYSYKQIHNISFSDCCNACTSDPLCVAFVLNKISCNLKNSTNYEPEEGDDCISVLNVKNIAPKNAKNILFIIADDMRPSLGSYGLPEAVTPNMDRLASEGLLFRHAYVQFAYCAPSRNSFMSGRRPDATKAYNFLNHFREKGVGANWTALPELFKNNGYLVSGSGKLFHTALPPHFDEPRSWSQFSPSGDPWPYVNVGKPNGTNECAEKCCGSNDTAHYCLYDFKDNGGLLEDEINSNVAWARLEEAIDNWQEKKQPFFVGQGFHRPHLPWNIPQENYENIESDPPEAKHKVFPATRPHIHFHDCAEMSHAYFDDNGWGVPLSQGGYWVTHQAEMRRAYYGALNYVDGMIGKALEILDERGVANDTIVMVTGDHGWHLGEFDEWCKMTNLELGTRVPLIFRAPFMKHSVGAKTSALAELVDLYPTLADLAGVPLPKENEGGEYLGGVSLKPIFEDPSSKVKDVALSQFPRCWQNNTHHSPHHKVGDESNFTVSWESMSDCHWTERNGLDFMGYRIRTSNFSFTQWFRWNMSDLRPIWKDVVGTELYDHTNDTGMAPSAFDDYEVINLAGNPAYADVQKSMTTLLKEEVLRWITPNP
eukprot:m.210119 g.210119  ORF g.210119 m.210119 type:complete len:630 (+) comp13779_c2_seq20:127-2016(+)